MNNTNNFKVPLPNIYTQMKNCKNWLETANFKNTRSFCLCLDTTVI